jgi:hypothetical protein
MYLDWGVGETIEEAWDDSEKHEAIYGPDRGIQSFGSAMTCQEMADVLTEVFEFPPESEWLFKEK